MAKKITLVLTEAQFSALVDITDTMSGMIGGGDVDFDSGQSKNVLLIDRMLEKNGYKRKYN